MGKISAHFFKPIRVMKMESIIVSLKSGYVKIFATITLNTELYERVDFENIGYSQSYLEISKKECAK